MVSKFFNYSVDDIKKSIITNDNWGSYFVIDNFLEKDLNKPSATIVIDGDLFKLYFEENVDLNLIKENLINKQRKYEDEMDKINSRLKNKNFVNRAPKHIVDQEKTNYNNLKKDIKKISFTVKSL